MTHQFLHITNRSLPDINTAYGVYCKTFFRCRQDYKRDYNYYDFSNLILILFHVSLLERA